MSFALINEITVYFPYVSQFREGFIFHFLVLFPDTYNFIVFSTVLHCN